MGTSTGVQTPVVSNHENTALSQNLSDRHRSSETSTRDRAESKPAERCSSSRISSRTESIRRFTYEAQLCYTALSIGQTGSLK